MNRNRTSLKQLPNITVCCAVIHQTQKNLFFFTKNTYLTSHGASAPISSLYTEVTNVFSLFFLLWLKFESSHFDTSLITENEKHPGPVSRPV
jgi:hypothetical protein